MSFYESIFRALPQVVIITDSMLRIALLNRKAEEILEIKEADAKGKHLAELINCPQIISLLQETIAFSAPPNLTYENSTVTFNVKGKKRYFKISLAPIVLWNDAEYVLTVLNDITILKEIDQFKTDFFATASHEYRTPLTSILMGVGIIKTGQLGELSPKGIEILKAIEEDCDRLLRLANHMLDLSRMETGSITLELEDVSVYKVVKAALRTLLLQAEKRNIKLYTKLASDLPMIKADVNKIIWVLTNLVGNALRYTNEGGSITVRAIRKGARLLVSVKDTGKGISPEHHDQVFQKYVQIKDDDYPSGGAGLGLAICKEIVEAHGGEIWVKSELGKGAVFTFSVPVSRG